MLLNSHWSLKKSKREKKIYLEASDKHNGQNLWYEEKAVLRGKFRTTQSYLKKQKNLK